MFPFENEHLNHIDGWFSLHSKFLICRELEAIWKLWHIQSAYNDLFIMCSRTCPCLMRLSSSFFVSLCDKSLTWAAEGRKALFQLMVSKDSSHRSWLHVLGQNTMVGCGEQRNFSTSWDTGHREMERQEIVRRRYSTHQHTSMVLVFLLGLIFYFLHLQ